MENDNSRRHYAMLLFECCVCFAAALLVPWGAIRLISGISTSVILFSHFFTIISAVVTFVYLARESDAHALRLVGISLGLACLPAVLLALSAAGLRVAAALVIVAAICLGIGMGSCMMFVAALLGSCVQVNGDAMFSSSIFIALLVSLALCWATPVIVVIASITFSAIAFLLYRFASSTMPDDLRIPRGQNVSVVKVKTSVALSCQTLCATVVIAVSTAADTLALPLTIAGSLTGVAIGGVAQRLAEGDHMNPASMQRATGAMLVSTVLVTGCAALLCNPHTAILIASPCASCAFAMLLVFNWNVLVTEVREFALAPLPHFKKGFVGIWVGVATGLAIAGASHMVSSLTPENSIIAYTLAIGFVTLCLAISPVFCKPDDTEDFDSIYQLLVPEEELVFKGKPQTLEKGCAAIAKKCSLTKREAQVLEYLARGRNAKHIQDELCVSFSTAKTHIYHIYQKLNVNSQQQLIDLVESANEH